MELLTGRTLRRSLIWTLFWLVALSGLWALQIEITYRQNVNRMPALLNFHRHVITRMWKA